MPASSYNFGPWWGSSQPAGDDSGFRMPLANYAEKMKAAMGAPAQPQSPLVAAYTPPAYQTTPPHVDVNAVIAAMNAAKNVSPQGGGQMPPGGPMAPGFEGGPNIGGERAVGGLPNMQEFQDFASGAKAAFGGFPGALADGVGMGFSGASADNAPSAMSDVVSAGQADHPGMGDAFYAKGGKVDAVAGPDPSGPDDGFIGADKGEYVVKKAAAKKVGEKAMNEINSGDEEVAEGVKEVTARLAAKDKEREGRYAPKRKDTDRDGDKKRDKDRDGK